MKKGIVFGAICAAVLFIATFAACSSNEPQLSDENLINNDPYSELIQDLDNFHTDYMANRSVEQSRCFGRFFKKLWNCVKADFADCQLGLRPIMVTIIAVPSASYEAWSKGYAVATTKEEYDEYVSALIQDESVLYQISDAISLDDNKNLGDIHNKILVELFKRCSPDDSYRKVVSTAAQVAREIGFSPVSLKDINTVSTDLKYFVENIWDESDEIMTERMKKYCPQKAKEIDVAMKYFSNIQNLSSIEEVKAYSEKYKAVIDASNISKLDKADLTSTIDVAPASLKLWSTVITEEKEIK